MSTIDTTRLLLEMRSLALEAGHKPAAEAIGGGTPAMDFGQALKSAVGSVNELQGNARSLAVAYESGDPGVDLSKVMLEVQKASVAFKAMTEVRNRLVSAYQEVMNMPV
jgi:flagellar hook-basal body complex protein FliE